MAEAWEKRNGELNAAAAAGSGEEEEEEKGEDSSQLNKMADLMARQTTRD
jgi:hypothetical protein